MNVSGLVRVLGRLLLFLLAYQLLVRLIRRFYKFPMPQFMADVIDNPWRRRWQPPAETARRHGLAPGMRVLDIGPGNGTYTVAAAQQVSPGGRVVATDVEPRMIARTRRRAAAAGLTDLSGCLADAAALPFTAGSFDAITMIAVIGELPHPGRALAECRRVLRPDGHLAVSELLIDPDYARAATLISQVEAAGFSLQQQVGNPFYYTLRLQPSASRVGVNDARV